MNQLPNNGFNRRKFLARTAKAGLSIATAAAVSYWAYDRQGPGPSDEADLSAGLADFSVPDQPGRTMSIVKGDNRKQTVRKAIDLLGGIGRFVKKGETVAIKPNVAFALAPMLGATAQPELVAEVVELCRPCKLFYAERYRQGCEPGWGKNCASKEASFRTDNRCRHKTDKKLSCFLQAVRAG